MRSDFHSDDYAIACCVSPMVIGKQMQFFGARANLAKTLLYAINGGVDEKLKIQVGPKTAPLRDEVLDYDTVMASLDHFMDWLAVQYISALNIIHCMHDKYSYEAALMALHDRDVYRTMACGIAGLSVAADSLSAIKYARVKPVRDHHGLAVDFVIEGDYPQYGNNDDRVDAIACDWWSALCAKFRRSPPASGGADPVDPDHYLQRGIRPKNRQHPGRTSGGDAVRSGGQSDAWPRPERGGGVADLGGETAVYLRQRWHLVHLLHRAGGARQSPVSAGKQPGGPAGRLLPPRGDGGGGQHLNVNVLNREKLLDAIEHPEQYPNLTIRVSGYAVRFNALTREQQQDVISRTFTSQL